MMTPSELIRACVPHVENSRAILEEEIDDEFCYTEAQKAISRQIADCDELLAQLRKAVNQP